MERWRRCAVCGYQVPRLVRGRCPACYGYWQRTGRERPPHLWHRDYMGRRFETPQPS
ncbi:MAG TPA: hypothetical protein VK066_29750 [Chloroflexota bacterium]|nr:hypothetical protein [Chloroflexota bacterium]